jgi:metal-responsive CopG/Arc/MetJ family transcriptional regulator
MKQKTKVGRPTSDTAPVNVRLPAEMLRAIDDWRRKEPDLPTRPEAIRRLLAVFIHEGEIK